MLVCRSGGPWRGLSFFAFDKNLAVSLLDLPAGERAERGRCNRFARLKTEMRVMPWAANRGADQQPIRQWPMVVGAMSGHPVQCPVPANQQNFLIPHMADRHGTFSKIAGWQALGKVGSSRCFVVACHRLLRAQVPVALDASDPGKLQHRPLMRTGPSRLPRSGVPC